MFLLKSLYGKVWSDTNSTELAQISTGQLYLVRPDSIQGSRECLFNNAMATIRRTTQEFNFQLVVTRVFEEGEEQLLDEDEETEDERSFLIDEQLGFRVGTFEGEPAFRWRDLHGDPNDLYEFVAIGTNQSTSTFFETCMYKAMWERKYNKSAEEASNNDLREFLFVFNSATESVQIPKNTPSKCISSPKSTTADHRVKEPASPKAPSKAKAKGIPELEVPQPGNIRHGTSLLNLGAELFFWDEHKPGFIYEGECEVQLLEVQTFQYAILARQDGDNILYHVVSPDNNGRFSNPFTSFTWNNINSDGDPTSWCLKFLTNEDYEKWKTTYSQSMYETLNHTSWEKVKVDERSYIISSHEEDVEMKDINEEEEVQAELAADKTSDASEPESEGQLSAVIHALYLSGEPDVPLDDSSRGLRSSTIHDEDSRENHPPEFPRGKNELLTVGFNKDRSYVARGDKIGVFKPTGEGKMEHHGTLSQVKNMQGKAFVPKKMMLYDQDNAMILMDPHKQNSLFKLDIESGKVVEEWKVADDVPVLHIAPETKFAQMRPERTVLGASGNALFRIDPRLPHNKLVNSEYKQYVSKNKFSSLATTETGKVAVASEKGDLRLFDQVGKNAKTALPAMGDPIIGVDVTKDGRWLVATCKTYLLVIDTLIGEGRYTGKLGFDRSFPADAKPVPRRLRLQNAHVQYMGRQVSFSPARFNMGEDQEETSIVTSSGNYVIAWDFKAIKNGKYDKYEIRKYEDVVVQDQFRYGDPNDIVVALQNNVVMINKKHLKNPTRPKSYGRRSASGSKSAIGENA